MGPRMASRAAQNLNQWKTAVRDSCINEAEMGNITPLDWGVVLGVRQRGWVRGYRLSRGEVSPSAQGQEVGLPVAGRQHPGPHDLPDPSLGVGHQTAEPSMLRGVL